MPLHDRTTWLRGDQFYCLQPPAPLGRTWRLVLLGPPGVGKGTQANLLSDVLGACPLSTGDIFRAARDHAAAHSWFRLAQERMNHGELVPDDIVLDLVRNRKNCLRCRSGFLLDGFPRTTAQAAALDGLLESQRVKLDAVILYELGAAELETRLAGRRVCSRCEAPYHAVQRPPRKAGVCDYCGGPIKQRADDRPEAVRARLRAYFEATEQVASYYRQKRILISVSAAHVPETVLALTCDLLVKQGYDVPLTRPKPVPADATR